MCLLLSSIQHFLTIVLINISSTNIITVFKDFLYYIIAYDVSIEGPVHVNMSPGCKSELGMFTFGMWVKVDSKGNRIKFEMFLGDTVSFSVSLSSDIEVATGR